MFEVLSSTTEAFRDANFEQLKWRRFQWRLKEKVLWTGEVQWLRAPNAEEQRLASVEERADTVRQISTQLKKKRRQSPVFARRKVSTLGEQKPPR